MKGLFSDKGEKKKAFYVLREWYEGKTPAKKK
jgi:beta-glucuronidase